MSCVMMFKKKARRRIMLQRYNDKNTQQKRAQTTNRLTCTNDPLLTCTDEPRTLNNGTKKVGKLWKSMETMENITHPSSLFPRQPSSTGIQALDVALRDRPNLQQLLLLLEGHLRANHALAQVVFTISFQVLHG